MNRLRMFAYCLKDGLYNLKRGGITSIISIITIAFTMLNLSLFFLLWINLSPLFMGWMNEVKVVGYLKKNTNEEAVEGLKKELTSLVHIKKVNFVSKSDAMERFQEFLGDDKSLLEGIDENPLPASFELVIDESAGLDAIESTAMNLQSRKEFEEVQSGREWMHRLSAFFVFIKVVGFLVGGVLIFISVFIISNTVRLTFINRKEEVQIMRLVGAHRWFIKMPFLIEGILDGLLGGGISISLLYLFYYLSIYKLRPYMLSTFGILRLSFIPYSVIIFILGLGMGVGGVGSLFSLKT